MELSFGHPLGSIVQYSYVVDSIDRAVADYVDSTRHVPGMIELVEHTDAQEDRIRTLTALLAEGYGGHIHLSHDAACFYDFMTGDPFFADEKPDYLLISNRVVPALLETGLTPEQIDQMMVEDPKRFFGGQ